MGEEMGDKVRKREGKEIRQKRREKSMRQYRHKEGKDPVYDRRRMEKVNSKRQRKKEISV